MVVKDFYSSLIAFPEYRDGEEEERRSSFQGQIEMVQQSPSRKSCTLRAAGFGVKLNFTFITMYSLH